MVSLIWYLPCKAWCHFLPVDGSPFGGFPSEWGSVQWGKERELWSHKDFGFGSTTCRLSVGGTWVGHSTFLKPGSLSKSDISLCHAVAIKMKCDSVCKQCSIAMAWEFTSFWPRQPALWHPSPSTTLQRGWIPWAPVGGWAGTHQYPFTIFYTCHKAWFAPYSQTSSSFSWV